MYKHVVSIASCVEVFIVCTWWTYVWRIKKLFLPMVHWLPSLSSVLQQNECHKVGMKVCLHVG